MLITLAVYKPCAALLCDRRMKFFTYISMLLPTRVDTLYKENQQHLFLSL